MNAAEQIKAQQRLEELQKRREKRKENREKKARSKQRQLQQKQEKKKLKAKAVRQAIEKSEEESDDLAHVYPLSVTTCAPFHQDIVKEFVACARRFIKARVKEIFPSNPQVDVQAVTRQLADLLSKCEFQVFSKVPHEDSRQLFMRNLCFTVLPPNAKRVGWFCDEYGRPVPQPVKETLPDGEEPDLYPLDMDDLTETGGAWVPSFKQKISLPYCENGRDRYFSLFSDNEIRVVFKKLSRAQAVQIEADNTRIPADERETIKEIEAFLSGKLVCIGNLKKKTEKSQSDLVDPDVSGKWRGRKRQIKMAAAIQDAESLPPSYYKGGFQSRFGRVANCGRT